MLGDPSEAVLFDQVRPQDVQQGALACHDSNMDSLEVSQKNMEFVVPRDIQGMHDMFHDVPIFILQCLPD